MKRLVYLACIVALFGLITGAPISVFGSSAKVVTVKTEDEYGMKAAALVSKYTSSSISAKAVSDPYQLMRLNVKGKKRLSFDQYGATEVIEGPDFQYLVQFPSAAAAKKANEELNSLACVSWSEPDCVGKICDEEPKSSNLRAVISSYSWGVSHINASNYANYLKSRTSKSITVAVVDTGVASHSFINSRILSGGYDFIDNDSNPAEVSGGTGHGTHVSGTIVDCTPGLSVKILPIRSFDKNGSCNSASIAASAVKYAANHGAKVINASWRFPANSTIDSAVNYAINKGVVFVCAAGNDSKNTSNFSPPRVSKAVVVSAINSSDQLAYFSNFGSSVDVAAPGVNIKSCVPGGGFESWQGTSMASPHVAAVAAMMRLNYPSKTPAEIESLIRSRAKDLGEKGWDIYYGSGLVYATVPKDPEENPSGISLNKTSLAMKRGDKFRLVATVTAPSTANTDVKWTTSDSDIAIVSGAGMVYAMKSGTATITATTVDGSKKATCTVKVTLSVTGGAVLKPLKSKTDYTSYDFTGDGVADKFRYNLDTAGKIVIKLNGKFTNLSTGSDTGLYYYKADRSNVFILEQTTVSWGTILRPYRYSGGKFVSGGVRIGIYDHTTIMSIAGGKLVVASGPVSMTKTNSFSGVYSEPFRFKESYKVNTATHKIVLASRYATLWMKRIYYYAGSQAIKLSTSPTSWNSNGPKLTYGTAVQIHRVYYSGSTPAKGQKYYEVTVNGTKCWLKDSTDVPLVDSCDLVY